MKNSAITAFLGWGVCCPGRFVGFLCLAQVVENLAGPCPGWALLRLRSLPPVEGTSVTSAPSFESFSKECCAFFFPAGFESVEKFPCNLLEFVLCSRGCLGMKTVLFFFFLKWSHRSSKESHKNCSRGLARLPTFPLPLVWDCRTEMVSCQQPLAVRGDKDGKRRGGGRGIGML